VFVFWLRTNDVLTTAELSSLLEPYDPQADPVMKETLDVMSVANTIIDDVVDRLLNEAAEKILKED
jgi:Mg/Co/Ni transporter MgtE